jgi:hypothetical protein
MAGLHNLGLIMDVLMPGDFQNADDLGRIWNTMLNNINPQNLDLTRIVAKSIARLSSASEPNFKVPEQQQKIMKGIFDLLEVQDTQVQNSSMEALREIVEINHEYMAQYLEGFYSITERFISRNNEDPDDKKVAEFSIEIWSILCEVEVNMAKNLS